MNKICPNAEGENYVCGKRAKDSLRQHLKTGNRLSYYLLDIDKYRRLIVRYFRGGKDINKAVVRARWAVTFTSYSDYHLKSEAEAKSKHTGL